MVYFLLEIIERTLIGLAGGVYSFVNWVYQIFLYIASARLLSNDDVSKLTDRLMIILGIVTLFIVSFQLIRTIIDPDKEIKNTSKIFTNVITSIIMLVVVNTAFNYAYQIQSIILTENLLGKIILGGVNMDNKEVQLENAGISMSTSVFATFFEELNGEANNYELDSRYSDMFKEDNDDTPVESITIADIEKKAMETDSFVPFKALDQPCDDDYIDFHFLMALFCGCFMVYLLASFAIDMAVRMAKISLLQIIAPIPILARIIPGQDSIFNNWIKKTITAFLEVFIKLSIIFFGVFLISTLGKSLNNLTLNESIIGGVSSSVLTFGYVAVVIGILLFIKQAPGYISEIFGVNSGNMKLGLKDKLSGMVGAGIVGGAVGATTGAIGAGWSSAINGGSIAKGIKYGAAGGWKNKWGQFNSQRQGLYNSMGFKGKAALLGHFEGKKFKLGGQSTSDKAFDDIKNSYVDDYKDNVIPKKIKEIENSEKFGKLRNQAESRWFAERDEMQTKHNSNIASIEAAREQAKNEYYNPAQVANRENEYYNNINAQKSAMLAQRSAKVAEFNKYRREQMDALRSRAGIDPTATDEFKKFRDMKFEDSHIGKDYMNKLNKLENAKFEDTKFENSAKFKEFEAQIKKENDNFAAAMEKYNNEDIKNDTIHDWAQADMMDADETYKNYVKIDKARKNEKNLNKWANSMEGQQAIYASQQGYKNAQKNPADGQKPKGPGQ